MVGQQLARGQEGNSIGERGDGNSSGQRTQRGKRDLTERFIVIDTEGTMLDQQFRWVQVGWFGGHNLLSSSFALGFAGGLTLVVLLLLIGQNHLQWRALHVGECLQRTPWGGACDGLVHI